MKILSDWFIGKIFSRDSLTGWSFIRLFMNINDFSDFLEAFSSKLFCTVRYSHVLTMYLSGHGSPRGHSKAFQNHRTVMNNNLENLHTKAPTHIIAIHAITIFIKISMIEFPGNPVKIFISWESASLTDSNNSPLIVYFSFNKYQVLLNYIKK